jgi:hypothetical protein
MHKIRKHLTYSNLVASVVIFLALSGGVAYAASHLAKHSVGVRQLRANSVTGEKVKDGSLTGADVDVSTLGQVPSAKSAAGAPPIGAAGGALGGSYPEPRIANRAITIAKLAGGIPHDVHVVRGFGPAGRSDSEQHAEARCSQGERVLDGGAFAPVGGATGFVSMSVDGPLETSTNSREYDGWQATAIEVNGGSAQIWTIEVYAVCAQL